MALSSLNVTLHIGMKIICGLLDLIPGEFIADIRYLGVLVAIFNTRVGDAQEFYLTGKHFAHYATWSLEQDSLYKVNVGSLVAKVQKAIY